MSEFKTTAPYRAVVGNVFSISDFVDGYSTGDKLYLVSPNGNKTEIKGNISFETAGEYYVIYKDGEKAESRVKVSVYSTPWYKVVYNGVEGYISSQ